MWHAHLGDPMPRNDSALTVGEPLLHGVRVGEAAREYEGLFRLVQQAGYTATAVDVSDAPEQLTRHALVWLAADPVLDEAAARRLEASDLLTWRKIS